MDIDKKNDLEKMYLALEDFGNEAGMIFNASNYVKRKGSNLSLSIKKGLKYMFTWDFPLMEDLNPSSTKFFLNSGIDYSENSNLAVGKPFGLKVEMVNYTTVLLGRAVILNEIIDIVLDGTIHLISDFINNPELKNERRFNFSNKISANLERLKREEIGLFENTRQADGLFKDLYNSFNDFITSENNILLLRQKINDGRLELVKAKVEELGLLSEALFNGMENAATDNATAPSKEFLKTISDELLYVAKMVEYYSIQMSRIVETNNVLHETEKQLRTL